MLVFEIGDMWPKLHEADLFIVTTNAVLNEQGSLVMGAGIAGQAAKRIKSIAAAAGKHLRSRSGHAGLQPDYYFFQLSKVGFLQTKRHYKEDSEAELIRKSILALQDHLMAHPEIKVVHMPMPGTGAGNLPYQAVIHDLVPLIPLTAKVHVWTKKFP